MGLLVDPLIVMKENYIKYQGGGGGGGSSAIPANMLCMASLETGRTTHPVLPIVHPVGHAIAALALLELPFHINNLGVGLMSKSITIIGKT